MPRFSLDASKNGETVAAGRLPVSSSPGQTPCLGAQAGTTAEAVLQAAKDGGSVKANESLKPAAGEATAARKRTGWLARLARLSDRPKAKRTPRLPPMTRMQVQGELSLDDVKPLRNDLTDSDIKVVPFRTTSATPTDIGPLLLRREDTGASARFLGATGRFFGTR